MRNRSALLYVALVYGRTVPMCLLDREVVPMYKDELDREGGVNLSWTVKEL